MKILNEDKSNGFLKIRFLEPNMKFNEGCNLLQIENVYLKRKLVNIEEECENEIFYKFYFFDAKVYPENYVLNKTTGSIMEGMEAFECEMDGSFQSLIDEKISFNFYKIKVYVLPSIQAIFLPNHYQIRYSLECKSENAEILMKKFMQNITSKFGDRKDFCEDEDDDDEISTDAEIEADAEQL